MAIAEAWGTLKEAIEAYAGVSPPTFFAAVGVAVFLYYAITSCFAPSPPLPRYGERELAGVEPLPPPVQIGEVTEEELRQYDGSDPKKPLLMAIKGQIYDVSQSRMFYGPGGPYALFAGKDASKALAKMSFEEKDLTGDISGLGPFELDALQEWEYKFMGKYAKVGTVKKPAPVADGDSSGSAAEATVATSENTPSEPREVSEKVVDEEPSDNASKSENASSPREVGEKGHATTEHKEANIFEAEVVDPKEVKET